MMQLGQHRENLNGDLFLSVQALGLTTIPGKTRDLGDHTLMTVKVIGMNCHQDLTWLIHAQDILMTSVLGALEGVPHKDGAMNHLMVLR